MDGYILGAVEPYAVSVSDTVRWQGKLKVMKGLVAFNDLEPEDATWLRLMCGGDTVAMVEPIPDYPPSWPNPNPIKGLKNKRCLTHTQIVAYDGFDVLTYDSLTLDPRVMGASWTDLGLLLVEFGSDDSLPLSDRPYGALWVDEVVDWRDARIATPV